MSDGLGVTKEELDLLKTMIVFSFAEYTLRFKHGDVDEASKLISTLIDDLKSKINPTNSPTVNSMMETYKQGLKSSTIMLDALYKIMGTNEAEKKK